MSAKGVYNMQLAFGFTANHLAMLCLVPWGNANSGDGGTMTPCWYDVAIGRSTVACKICGVNMRVSYFHHQWLWIEDHEKWHVRQLGEERMLAFHTLLGMRGLPEPFWSNLLKDWRDRYAVLPVSWRVKSVHRAWMTEAAILLECGREVFGPPQAPTG